MDVFFLTENEQAISGFNLIYQLLWQQREFTVDVLFLNRSRIIRQERTWADNVCIVWSSIL